MRFSLSSLLIPALLLMGGEATAQTSVDRSFDPAPKDCADVHWSPTVLQAFPSIGGACQSIEQRNGKTYVKLSGEVEEVRNEGKRIRVDFEDGNKLTFRPTPNTVLYVDGNRSSFADLRAGTHLNFYIPEDRLQAELQPDPNRLAFVIIPLNIPIAQAGAPTTSQDRMASNEQQLPRTAGPLPLLGLGGLAALVLAGGITLRRKLR